MMPDKIVPFPGAQREEAPLTEDSVAVLVAREHGADIRYSPERGKWLIWTGKRWLEDSAGYVFEACRSVCRTFSIATSKDKWGKHSVVSSVERFLRTEADLVAPAAMWDDDPLLLGTPGGYVDLRTGEFFGPARDKYITKFTSVDPSDDDDEPVGWLDFLHTATRGDAQLIRYLQQLTGYALTGQIKDHALFFVYGHGGNGKGTFLDVLRAVMGSYAVHAPTETFMDGLRGRHSTELAMLHGARLVTASETEGGQAWNESRIKALTGGDPVTARFMGKDFFTFAPTFKLVIIGNHRPVLKSVDDAARRRLRMIPFKFKPETPDRELPEKLQREYPQILRWMINGCIDWQAERMDMPDIVRKETMEYFEDQDAIGQWRKECIEIDESIVPDEHLSRCLSSKLFKSWAAWAAANGEKAGTNKAFSEEMTKAGFRKKRGGSGVEFFGVRLKPQSDHDGDANPTSDHVGW